MGRDKFGTEVGVLKKPLDLVFLARLCFSDHVSVVSVECFGSVQLHTFFSPRLSV